jgi:beta-xylosidase
MKHLPLLSCLLAAAALGEPSAIPTGDIRVRDPFIYADAKTGTYFLYVQSENRAGSDYKGVEIYTSKDLKTWTPPRPVLTLPDDSGVIMVWAPEMHACNGAYYLFVTLTFRDTLGPQRADRPEWPPLYRRGTWVYRADSPEGPFAPLRGTSHTPPGDMALDGTLHVEPDGTPWMVYCHEWVQIADGAMVAVKLTRDLSAPDGKPVHLFKVSDAPDTETRPDKGKVTDGPFLYTAKDGALLMIWSTFCPGKGYCVLLARSESGRVTGPWTGHTPLYTTNGGHGMIFKTFGGKLMLALHQPNIGRQERLRLIPLTDDGGTLRLENE